MCSAKGLERSFFLESVGRMCRGSWELSVRIGTRSRSGRANQHQLVEVHIGRANGPINQSDAKGVHVPKNLDVKLQFRSVSGKWRWGENSRWLGGRRLLSKHHVSQ